MGVEIPCVFQWLHRSKLVQIILPFEYLNFYLHLYLIRWPLLETCLVNGEDMCFGRWLSVKGGALTLIHMTWLCDLKWEKTKKCLFSCIAHRQVNSAIPAAHKQHSPCVCEEAFRPLSSPLVVAHAGVVLPGPPLPTLPWAHKLTSRPSTLH